MEHCHFSGQEKKNRKIDGSIKKLYDSFYVGVQLPQGFKPTMRSQWPHPNLDLLCVRPPEDAPLLSKLYKALF